MPKGWGLYRGRQGKANALSKRCVHPRTQTGLWLQYPSFKTKELCQEKISTLQGVAAMQGHGTEGKGTGWPAHDSAL